MCTFTSDEISGGFNTAVVVAQIWQYTYSCECACDVVQHDRDERETGPLHNNRRLLAQVIPKARRSLCLRLPRIRSPHVYTPAERWRSRAVRHMGRTSLRVAGRRCSGCARRCLVTSAIGVLLWPASLHRRCTVNQRVPPFRVSYLVRSPWNRLTSSTRPRARINMRRYMQKQRTL